MTKIMLVEDDKNIREIYGVRLLAEGYQIVTASDGEEALAVAVKEKPDLIVADIMMPRISGFDMLDILRSTAETKNIKVIVLTALSSEDQRKHGESLGADLYLVKSQVGIEDVVRSVHNLLGDSPGQPQAGAAPAAPSAAPPTPPAPADPSLTDQSTAQPTPAPVGDTPAAPATPVQSAPTPGVMPPADSTTPTLASARQRVVQPVSDPTPPVNMNELLEREKAREAEASNQGMPQPQ